MNFLTKLVLSIGSRINIPSPMSWVVKEANLAARLSGGKVRILDIGHGRGNHWATFNERLTRTDFNFEITAFDMFIAPSLIELSGSKLRLDCYLQGEAPAHLAKITSQSFDIVIGFDLIEHLSKEEGYKLLYEMERISKFSAVIFTPNGHVWQPPTFDNPLQAHISGWTPSELKAFGWNRVRGATGLKFMFGPYAEPRGRLGFLNRILAVGFSRVSLYFPRLAFSFVAIYRQSNSRQ